MVIKWILLLWTTEFFRVFFFGSGRQKRMLQLIILEKCLKINYIYYSYVIYEIYRNAIYMYINLTSVRRLSLYNMDGKL